MRKTQKIFIFIIIAALLFCIGVNILEEETDKAFAEGYDSGYNVGYSAGHSAGASAQRKATRPLSGTILYGKEYDKSEITVTADSSEDYVVLLKDAFGDSNYDFSFYVRAGETVTIGTPARYMFVYFACGDEWYGYGKGLMFGSNTHYSKDDEVLNFADYSWEYTLYPVSNGNFSETPIKADEFF